MKCDSLQHHRQRGITLAETIVSMSVLAVAIPLVFGALVEASRTGGDAGMDNRSASIIPACIQALARAREGLPGWFEASPHGRVFPREGDVWALAFSEGGNLVGRVSKAEYENGLRELAGESVRYLASMSARPQEEAAATGSPLRLAIIIEYPAAAPSDRRGRQEFYSMIR